MLWVQKPPGANSLHLHADPPISKTLERCCASGVLCRVGGSPLRLLTVETVGLPAGSQELVSGEMLYLATGANPRLSLLGPAISGIEESACSMQPVWLSGSHPFRTATVHCAAEGGLAKFDVQAADQGSASPAKPSPVSVPQLPQVLVRAGFKPMGPMPSHWAPRYRPLAG